jgi:sec-independent protein translocase protein TatA
MFRNAGGWQLIVILFVVLLLFGGRKLPELANALGRSVKELRKATEDDVDEDKTVDGSHAVDDRDQES